MMKHIVILGGGESGIGAALLAQLAGYRVFLSDAGTIPAHWKEELKQHAVVYEEGGHTPEKVLDADMVVKSPGIPEKIPMMQQIRAKGIEVISEIEFAYRHAGKSTIVAITGSNGKTTTTTLIYHMCKQAGLDCALVGNVGYSFARQVAMAPKPLYVAEVSSFQLDDISTFRPHIAVLTNITDDHLDRYDYDPQKYIKSKFNIAKYQLEDDVFIYNLDDEAILKNLNNYPIKSTKAPFT
ncbi:MAG TPA: Mur ligase family protein, partial [Ferruginibacter sp.]|nr:Mur ligase family protein [Ferruginibacter sp.]